MSFPLQYFISPGTSDLFTGTPQTLETQFGERAGSLQFYSDFGMTHGTPRSGYSVVTSLDPHFPGRSPIYGVVGLALTVHPFCDPDPRYRSKPHLSIRRLELLSGRDADTTEIIERFRVEHANGKMTDIVVKPFVRYPMAPAYDLEVLVGGELVGGAALDNGGVGIFNYTPRLKDEDRAALIAGALYYADKGSLPV